MRRWIYSAVLYFITPLVLLRLWRKGRVSPGYRQRIPERFALGLRFSSRPRIWLHAVSVGETIAAAPLIRRLLADYPDHVLLVTSTTPTGSEQLRRLFPDEVEHVYFPYDLPDVISRFLTRVKPQLIVLMETEIWPNLYAMSEQRGIPLLLVNARLSEKSFGQYQRVSGLMADTLQKLSGVLAQGQEDARRLEALGVDGRKVQVAGNIKYDLSIPQGLREKGRALRLELGDTRPVWIAASTHEGEDELILEAHKAVLEKVDEVLLILVPRHPERFGDVTSLCEKEGFALALRSTEEKVGSSTQVFLGDSMGELMLLYAASDVAFVGGSLVKTGGHNPLEPASLGMALVTGPHIHNFDDVYAGLLNADAALKVETADELADVVVRLLADARQREVLGENARKIVQENQGGIEVILREVGRCLEAPETRGLFRPTP